MSFIFRRLSLRRPDKGRSKSWPPSDQIHGATPNNDDSIGTDSSSHSQPQPSRADCRQNYESEVAKDQDTNIPHCSITSDVYEDRIEELGSLMQEQGRYIDGLTNRSRIMSTENSVLRERMSENIVSNKSAASSPNRSPLKNIANVNRSSKNEQAKCAQAFKEENALLIQQADLLANELTGANKLIADRDVSIISLSKELSSCLEKARLMMVDKKTWKTDVFQKTKEIETLEADVKRSKTLRSEISHKAELYLAERKGLEVEVTDLGSQMSHLASKVEDLHTQLALKQGEIEKISDRSSETEQASKLARQEAKIYAEATIVLQDTLRRSKLKNEQLGTKLGETRDLLDDSQISNHKLQTCNADLQVEIKSMSEKHKAHVSSWTKGQNKIIATMKEQHLEAVQSQQKIVDNLRRANSSLERDSTHCNRELHSCQQRCSALEKQLAGRDREERDASLMAHYYATDAKTQLETSQISERELKLTVSTLEEKFAAIQFDTKTKEGRHTMAIGRLQTELLSMQEQNETLSTRIQYLEEGVIKIQQTCAKEKQKIQRETERKIGDIDIECETLRVATESAKLKARESEELLERHISLAAERERRSLQEKNEVATKTEKELNREREMGRCLMKKVQELHGKIHTLTAEKLQLHQQSIKCREQIHTLEHIIAGGEIKMSQLGKQLARLIEERAHQI